VSNEFHDELAFGAPAATPAIAPGRAYLSLLMENQRGMYALICSLLGNSEHAHDVLQETNLVMWEKAGEYDPARPFRPWAFRFAHNQVLAFRKKVQRDRLVFDEQMLAEIHDRTMTATDRLEDQLKSLDACMKKLPPRQHELVRRRYADGQKLKEIAAATRQSANALAAMLFRARRAILRCMKGRLAGEAEK
jgi:RNA polymerase sigma-70 factor, ECF subfamily